MKPALFFIVALITLTYLASFWENRKTKVKFNLFHQDIEISLGILAFGLFLDGAILSGLLLWLME